MKFFITIILVALSTLSYSQAWVKKKGEYYAKFGINSTNAKSIFNSDSKKITELDYPTNDGKIPHLHEIVYQLYGQYGTSDKTDLLISLPFKSITNKDKNYTVFGVADIEVGLTYAWKQKKWQITPAIFAGLPVGYFNKYDKIDYCCYPPTVRSLLFRGDGEFNLMPRLYFGRGFSKPFYVTGFLGYNYRTNGQSDEIDALIEGGYTMNKLIFILKLQIKESFYQGEAISYTGLYDTGQEYLSPHFSLYYKHTKNLHFSLNIGGAVYARHAQGAASINFGIAYEK